MTATLIPPATAQAHRDPNVLRWLGAYTSSMLGDSVYYLALSWAAVQAGSPAQAGLVMSASALPRAVLMLGGGVVADRFGPRRVVIGSDAVRCAAVLAVAAVLFLTSPGLWPLALLAMVFGTVDAVFMPAVGALPARLTEKGQLARVQGMRGLAIRLASVVGAPLGGLAVALGGAPAAFTLAGLLIALSLPLLISVRVRDLPDEETEKTEQTEKTEPGDAGGDGSGATAMAPTGPHAAATVLDAARPDMGAIARGPAGSHATATGTDLAGPHAAVTATDHLAGPYTATVTDLAGAHAAATDRVGSHATATATATDPVGPHAAATDPVGPHGGVTVSAPAASRARAADPVGSPVRATAWGDLKAGLRYIRRHRVLAPLMVAIALGDLGFVGPLNVGLTLLADRRGWGAAGMGWVLAGFGAGAGAASLLLTVRGRLPRAGLVAGYAIIAGCVAIGALAYVPGLVAAVVTAVLVGLLTGLSGAMCGALLQTQADPAYLGRVTSVSSLVSLGLTPLSMPFAAAAIGAWGLGPVFVASAVVCGLGGAVALAVPALRRAELPG
ncbi:MFS transporter [Streptomyces sp. NPDC052721]|uniref:MFS transporter n=1 Tax=Streptomyces sp. NPDC052721 TaxID=3154955 RepID=UPI00342F3D3D